MIEIKDKIKIESYGDYSTKNYGVNSLYVKVGKLGLYFSYGTVIAFEYEEETIEGYITERYICENIWGTTTGKHINWIDRDKKRRLPREQFEAKLNEVLEKLNL